MSKLSKAAKTASTLGGALGCAAKIRRGESCNATEMRAALLALSGAYNALKAAKRAADDKASMLSSLLQTSMRQ